MRVQNEKVSSRYLTPAGEKFGEAEEESKKARERQEAIASGAAEGGGLKDSSDGSREWSSGRARCPSG